MAEVPTERSEERPETEGHPSSGELATAISNAVVGVYVDYLGRGPTRARTVIGHDLVTVVLGEGLTKAEQRLVIEGESETVVTTRRTFQKAMKDDLVAAVEGLTGRTVHAFLSDQSTEPDVAVEVFTLTPQSGDGAGPA